MKKSISILLVLLIIAGAAGAYYFFFWKRAGALGDLKAAEYVPSQTGALIEITDWQRTKTRWKETALYKISQEPEVAEFLEKPESKIPADKQLERLARFQKLEPKEVFVAFTAIGVAPKVVAGFDYKGSQADAEALVEDLKGDLKDQYPDGKSDIEKYGESNIETFANKEETMATVFKGKWFFISNDTGLLKETLDRVDGKTDVKTSLRENESYKTALAKLPKDSDGVVFIGRGVIGPLIMMASMSPGVESAEVNELMKIDSISASMKLDGENIRDAFYVNKPGGGKAEAPLARNSLAYTTAGTVLYFTTAIPLDKAPVMPNPALDRSGILSAVDNFRQMLAQAGLGFDDFKSAYGPEMGLVTNWEQDSLKPDWMLALDVRDKEKAQKFIETLTAGHGGAAAWAKQEIDGTQFYSMPQSGGGLIPVSPVLALTDKSVLFGMDVDSVKKAAQRAKADGAGIDKDADFQAASGLVSKPTGAFGYINTAVLFDKVYGLASNILKMGAIFNPHASDYADLGKLPSGEVISKHLGPIVYSQSSDENGLLIESVGPVTFTEVLLVAGGAGAAYMWKSHGEANEPPTATFPAMTASPPVPDQTGTAPGPSSQPAQPASGDPMSPQQ